ncbi:MAG TPA: proton-conducting transporter membrane subunit [Streptosporangiaceae bacterium]|nr:proton-conducting transporter membrane subunit [Streptosporangiaceae bacterium]
MIHSSVVFAFGLALLLVAGLDDLVFNARPGRLRGAPYLLGAVASACLAATGAGALAGSPARLNVAGWLGSGTTSLTADRLSGLFLVISFTAAFAVSLAFAAWASRPELAARRGLGASYALTLGAVAVFLTSTDAFTMLFGWELLTLGFYLLAGFDRQREDRISASMITLTFGKISGAALLLGLLLLAARSGSLAIASFAHVPGGVLRSAAQTLLIAGFAVKVGLVPFQVWLPRGYAAAPGPARAIMGGVAVNVGFYGLWRTLALLGPPPSWLIGLLLVLAGITALLGIAHAAVQPRLHRVIAYSSVENSGLILAGYGVALVGTAIHDQQLAAVGLLAGTLQIVAHAAAKSLLFTASAAITSGGDCDPAAPPADNLDSLIGSARRRPWSGTGLAIGSLTLAGLPVTIGFASEWFLLEALMQQFRVPLLGYRLLLAVAGAAVALTAGFAGVTFVRLTGLVVLGPKSANTAAGQADGDWDYGWLGRAGLTVLSLGCLAVAALLPLVIRVAAIGLGPVVTPAVTRGALKSPWVLQPVFSGFSILSPSWLWIVMPLLAIAVLAFTRLVSGTRMVRVRRVPAWQSATAGVDGPSSYTASGYANPTRRILRAVLHTRSQVEPLATAPQPEPGPRLSYSSDVIEVVEAYLYRPLLPVVMTIVRMAKRLQSGRLDAYLGYMLIALVGLLAVVVAFAG